MGVGTGDSFDLRDLSALRAEGNGADPVLVWTPNLRH
jgi:hypothetical protein